MVIRGLAVRAFDLEGIVAKITPEHRGHAVFMCERKCLGDFDDLPGTGKPLPDRGELYDDEWWLKDWIRRENLTGLAPESLKIRKEAQDLLERLGYETQESAVRRAVDKLNETAYFTLLNVMKTDSHLAPQALTALMISRALERVADHATNIAEDVIFWVRGADVRHHMHVDETKPA